MRREYETVMRLQAPLERELDPEEIALQELVERNAERNDVESDDEA